MTNKMNIPKLRAKIAETGIKYSKIAKELGITPQALNRKMRGRTRFSLDDAIQLCTILKIDVQDGHDIFLTLSSQFRDKKKPIVKFRRR